MTRVSENMRYESTNNRINTIRRMMDNVNETAISGKKLRQISQDPAGSVRVFRNRTKLKNIEQFRKTADFARGFLGRSEDSLMSMNDLLIRARELAIQQSNSTWDAKDRESVSAEVKELINESVTLANSTYADRYVFGGFRTQTPPLTPEGDYLGDDGKIYVQMDETNFRPVNVSSRSIFDDETNPKSTPIKALRELYEALKNNNMERLRESIPLLEKSSIKTINALSSIGSRLGAIDDIDERLSKNEENYIKDSSTIEDADMVKSALDLRKLKSSLEYTMQASAKALTPSLMEFLR